MKSLNFEGANVKIGGQQNQYNTLHARVFDPEKGGTIMIFELTDEEIEEIIRTKKLVYIRLTFGESFQPMRIMTHWPNESPPPILPDINSDPKLN